LALPNKQNTTPGAGHWSSSTPRNFAHQQIQFDGNIHRETLSHQGSSPASLPKSGLHHLLLSIVFPTPRFLIEKFSNLLYFSAIEACIVCLG
jgi:hypothetical protein